jgi:hypothetical protein
VTKAPLAGGKNGGKRHMPVDGAGVPLALAVTGANRHDVSRLEAVSDSIVIGRPDIFECPRHLCLDKGFTGESALETVVLRGFVPHIISEGEEKTVTKTQP